MKVVPGHAAGGKKSRANARIGLARLTYRAFVRQIRGVLQVAMSLIPMVSEKRPFARGPLQYQYSAAKQISVSLGAFKAYLQRFSYVTERVSE